MPESVADQMKNRTDVTCGFAVEETEERVGALVYSIHDFRE
jgi:hypothetical protein